MSIGAVASLLQPHLSGHHLRLALGFNARHAGMGAIVSLMVTAFFPVRPRRIVSPLHAGTGRRRGAPSACGLARIGVRRINILHGATRLAAAPRLRELPFGHPASLMSVLLGV
jgi:hypothetical protein